jgi:hypothetical protein
MRVLAGAAYAPSGAGEAQMTGLIDACAGILAMDRGRPGGRPGCSASPRPPTGIVQVRSGQRASSRSQMVCSTLSRP